jgi:quercetin dioxygenase-like cupin family protein
MAAHEQEAQQLPYARLYADSEDESHFEDEDMPLGTAGVPGAPPFIASEALSVSDVRYVGFEPGYAADEHPSTAPRFCLTLSGEMELTASDSETRVFTPGSVLLMEDTTGKGHSVEFPSDERAVCATIILSC